MSRSPKKLKSLIEVPNLVHVKVHIHFRANLVDQVKGRSPKRLKSLIKVPNVAHLRVQAVSLNLNLFFSPQSVPRPSYTFRKIFGRSGKGSFAEKSKIVDRGSICSTPENTGSNLLYEPFLFLDQFINFGKNLRDQVKNC